MKTNAIVLERVDGGVSKMQTINAIKINMFVFLELIREEILNASKVNGVSYKKVGKYSWVHLTYLEYIFSR
jgi:hypothetical protein